MNIFLLDSNPKNAAQMMCDKHVVKMILESAQMLCTAHHISDKNVPKHFYRMTHQNHPCTRWVTQATGNYKWLFQHFSSLCKEYTYRYGKIHLTQKKLWNELKHPPKNLPHGPRTYFVLAMPEKFKCDCAVTSYRNYYRHKSRQFVMKWSRRKKPKWLPYPKPSS